MNTVPFNVLIVDDEPLARKEMLHLLKTQTEFVPRWEAGSIAEATHLLRTCRPDVVFLDIELRGGSGFDLISEIHETTDVVFVTAYDTYAVRAFEVNALDYLTKPVSAERFNDTINRLQKKRDSKHRVNQEPLTKVNETDKVLISTQNGRTFVNCHQINAVRSEGGNYISIRMASQMEHLVRGTVKHWEQRLPSGLFLRIHRNALVNTTQIASLDKAEPRRHTITLKGSDEKYHISREVTTFVQTLLLQAPPEQ